MPFLTSSYRMKWIEFFPHKGIRSSALFEEVLCLKASTIIQAYLAYKQEECSVQSCMVKQLLFWSQLKQNKQRGKSQCFVMLRVISVIDMQKQIQAQIPKVVLDGVKGLKDEVGDSDELDNEAVVKAYVNIVVGTCISLALLLPWLRFADSKDERAHELLYSYVFAFLNEGMLKMLFTKAALPLSMVAVAEYMYRGSSWFRLSSHS
ncbi:hypothetical protein Tco_0590985 [Tanacetum coccineum]